MRPKLAWILIVLFIAPAGAAAQEDADLLRAMQRSMTRVIQQHENSIACILVGRSEHYPRDPKHPGKLGGYEPERLLIDPEITGIKRQLLIKKLDLADPANVPPSFGSGVVVDARGLVLTNYHVVREAAKIYVRLPGGKGSYADIHAADPRSDLAVLKLLNPDILPLRAIPLGDADKMERGQFILTLSNPYAAGFRDGQPSASYGILSNVRRRTMAHLKEEERVKPFHHYSTLLQTDARLHLGCSGGALLNLKGEMVGLLTSLAAIQGSETPGGFAVPINAGTRPIIEVLKRGEEVEYGFLGVAFDPKSSTGQVGVPLTLVGDGGPADVDGKLKRGDILLAVNGQPIHESDDVYTTIGMSLAGTKVKLQVRRNQQIRVVDVTLAKLYVPGQRIASSQANRPFVRGLRVDHTSLLVQTEERAARVIPRGVLVSDIAPKTAAADAKLKLGDVITHVNGIPVANPGQFYQIAGDARGVLELTLQSDPATRVFLR